MPFMHTAHLGDTAEGTKALPFTGKESGTGERLWSRGSGRRMVNIRIATLSQSSTMSTKASEPQRGLTAETPKIIDLWAF
ncbi:MAG: hypothetical protein ABI747_03615 [Candidatus Moraniibacteriota bacterium]